MDASAPDSHPRSLGPRSLGGLALTLSTVSLLAAAVMAATPGSPYQPPLTPNGQPVGPLRDLAVAMGLAGLHGTPLIVVSTVVAAVATAAFLLLLREAFRGHVGLRPVAALVVGAHLALVFVPLVFSRDVYSYAIYGRIAAIYGGNPYVQTPLDHPGDPLWSFVGPKWVDTPAVYGPAWSSLSAGVARIFGQPSDVVKAYQVLAIVASLATCLAIVWVVRARRPDRVVFALVAFGANPVVLFHSVASGHNDLLVALAIVFGLGLALRGRERWAVAVLTLGALVKATAVLPLVLLIVWCVARRAPDERRRVAIVLVSIAGVIGLAFAAPYLQLHDPTLGMLQLATHEGWLAPSVAFSRVVEFLSFGVLGWVPRVVFGVILLVWLVRLTLGVWRRGAALSPDGVAASWGWALILFTLLGPVLLPWYIVWSLPLVWALPRSARTLVITTGSLLAVTLWSAEPLRFPVAFSVDSFLGRWVITPIILVLLVRAIRDLGTRLDAGLALEDDEVAVSDGAPTPPPRPRERVPTRSR